MNRKEKSVINYGLIGKNIAYSFSPTFFNHKFENEKINALYQIFDLQQINHIKTTFSTPNLNGLNVTTPYKQDVIPFLDELSNSAKEIGAVNTIQFKDRKKIGHNTDYIGFKKSIEPLLKSHHKNALILGTGGATKAVKFALKQLNINFSLVSRDKHKADFTYAELNSDIIKNHSVIINATPLGTFPNIEAHPQIPFEFITKHHLVYDLIYNPAKTKFLQLAEQKGATIKNGLEMLELQALAAWEIWNG